MNDLQDAANEELMNQPGSEAVAPHAICTASAGAKADDVAPMRADSAADGVLCKRCQRVNPRGLDRCERCRSVLKGNTLSQTTGMYATLNTSPEMRAREEAGRTIVAQSVVDAGGREELSAREVALHEYRGLLHERILKLALALRVHGDFDKRGRLRKNWIELKDRLINSAAAIDKTLGLRRKAKRIASARDIVAEYQRRDEEAGRD